MTNEQIDAFMENLNRISPIIIAERKRAEAVIELGEALEQDKKIPFITGRMGVPNGV